LHACQLFKEAPKNNVKFSSYVGDDDSTALAELVKQTPYELQKYSDIIHMKRSLSTHLYNLSQQMKFPNCSIHSQKVINYLIKCFSYCVQQNKGNKSELSKSLKSIILHVFGADFTQILQPTHTMNCHMERIYMVLHLGMPLTRFLPNTRPKLCWKSWFLA
jgi:hexokinase